MKSFYSIPKKYTKEDHANGVTKKQIMHHSLKNYYLLFLIAFAFSCNPKEEKIIPDVSPSEIKVIIKTDTIIDNVIFTPFGGFTRDDLLEFKDTLHFNFESPIRDFYQLICMVNGRTYLQQLWLEGKGMEIHATFNNHTLDVDTILNSPFHYYAKDVIESIEEYKQNPGPNHDEFNDFIYSEISKNRENPFIHNLVDEFLKINKNDHEALAEMYELLKDDAYFHKEHFLSAAENLKNSISKNINFSDFSFLDMKKKEIKLDIHNDSIILIDFWATYCKPCIEEHEAMAKEMERLRKSNIRVIGISIDTNIDAWQKLLQKKNYKWENYVQAKGKEAFNEHLGINSLPTYIIINHEGTILNREYKFENSMSFLRNSDRIK